MTSGRDSSERGRSIGATAIAIAGLAVVYVVAGRLGLGLAHYHESATLIWPPTGISLAVLILFGARLAPGVLIGAFVVNASMGTPLSTSAAIAVGNTLEALTGFWLLTHVGRLDPALARLRDVVAFFVLGVLISTTVSATIGLLALSTLSDAGVTDAWRVWSIWWLGDAGGAVMFTPVILVGLHGRPPWSELVRRLEAWVVVGVLLVILLAAFSTLFEQPGARLVAAMLAFPCLVWGGLRLGPRGALVCAIVTAVAAVIGTAQGMGPFAHETTAIRLFLLWAYATTMCAAGMILAAAIAEREAAEAAHLLEQRKRGELQAQLRHRQRLESLGVLAGGIAHDFNNLLAVIRGNAELIRASPTSLATRGSVDDIEVATRRAAELCDQLLTYAGKNPPATGRVDLAELLQETRRLLRTSVPARIELSIVVAPDVSPVRADATQVQQVLINLVTNAAEAIEDDPGRIHVEVGATRADLDYLRAEFLHCDAPPGEYVYIEVRDDGVGMTEAQMARLFDPFYTTRFEGRGLGLASVLGIVQAHGGAIKVRSEPGGGAIFRVLLPPYRASSQPEPEVPTPPEGLDRGTGVVLIADDDDMVLRVTATNLERGGWTTLRARDGREAVSIFERDGDRIDAVVLDLMMPQLSGVEALERMHRLRPDVPALIVTGDETALREPDDRKLEVLRKPYPATELRRRVASLIAAASANHPGSKGARRL